MSRFLQTQQPQDPTILARFQLAKFSYTSTSNNHRGPLNWSHVFGNGDMVAIFEKYTAYSPRRVLFRVLRNDRETLEEVGITDLVREFESQINAWQDSSRRPSFAVVVKPPCLAVKYPQGPTFVRRFQIKFLSDRDFYSALAILSDINCPFSEANVSSVRPLTRPASSLSNLGQVGPGPGLQRHASTLQRCPSTAIGAPLSGFGMRTSTGPSISSNAVANAPPAIDVYMRSSSPSSATLSSATHHFSSSTAMSSSYRAPLEVMSPANNVPPARASTEQCIESPKRPVASSVINELDLPPKRDLPFEKPNPKRSRTTSMAASKTTAKKKVSPKKALARKKAASNNKTSPDKSKTASPLPAQTPKENPISKSNNPGKFPRARRLTPSSTPPTNPLTQETRTTATTNPTTLQRNLPKALSNQQEPLLATPSNLAEYISNPTAERTASLQSWLCAHLEDESFLQLCVDVEGIAERFMLGR